jgi:hypothetical protein
MNMFNGCTGLTSAPVLSSTSLAGNCYFGMFNGCTSLTTAPDLPAEMLVDHCYGNMFRDCTSLQGIKCLATNLSGLDCLSNWMLNVPAGGTFTKKTGVAWPTGSDGIPDGWTVVEL